MRTNAGTDFQAAQMGSTSPGSNGANYVALSTNATAPSATDTTLAGEITTAGGGLVRAQGTYGHTTGAASYTVTKVFTANGSDALPATIKKVGVLTAASVGTLVFEDAITDATFNASGDNLTVTQTVSL
jgi:hypothetical protein